MVSMLALSVVDCGLSPDQVKPRTNINIYCFAAIRSNNQSIYTMFV